VDVLPFLGGGNLRYLTVSAPMRVPQLPDTPTATEAGLPNFVASSWFAFYLPKGVPDAIRDRFTDALRAALDDDSVRKRLELAGLILPRPDQQGSEPLKRRMAEEIVRWKDIVQTAKIQLDQ
jgi:tripartite-type tricarboxylate transporter receptor subunit TctC